jgi:hypothetical protein
VVLAAVIASRKLQSASQTPSFVSAVFVTVNVAACATQAVIINKPAIVTTRQTNVFVKNIELSPANMAKDLLTSFCAGLAQRV